MEIINKQADEYAAQFTSSQSELLQQIAEQTYAHHQHAHMLSGHVQGKFLEMISYMVQPLYVLEIGTFTGFSALCLAAGLRDNGILHTIEIREEDATTAQNNFNKSKYKDQIKMHIGAAKNIIPELQLSWDIVFIDADKTNYIDYYELTLPFVKRGGVLIADNVLFHGEVLQEKITGKNATAIHAFNKHIAADERTEQIMLTLRDGISLIRKR